MELVQICAQLRANTEGERKKERRKCSRSFYSVTAPNAVSEFFSVKPVQNDLHATFRSLIILTNTPIRCLKTAACRSLSFGFLHEEQDKKERSVQGGGGGLFLFFSGLVLNYAVTFSSSAYFDTHIKPCLTAVHIVVVCMWGDVPRAALVCLRHFCRTIGPTLLLGSCSLFCCPACMRVFYARKQALRQRSGFVVLLLFFHGFDRFIASDACSFGIVTAIT